jgi:hypothetical protein
MYSFLDDKIQHIISKRNADIIIMDNSSLSVWEECNRKFLYRVLLALKDPKEKAAITFGKAFHKFLEWHHSGHTFLESYEQFVLVANTERSRITVTKDESIDNNQKQEYSLEFAFILCKKYADTHPLDREYFTPMKNADGEVYLEMGFAMDLLNGIIIGLIDGLGVINSTKREIVVEHKSTGYNINASYLADFNPNNQVSTYLYAASELLGRPITTALINVIRVKDYKRGDKEDNDTKLFGRIETHRDTEQLEQRMRHANFQLGQIKQSIDAGLDGFPMHTQSCRTKYGECEYRKLCMCKNDTMIQILAESVYVTEPWSPYEVLEGVEKVVEIDVAKKGHEVKKVDEFISDSNR